MERTDKNSQNVQGEEQKEVQSIYDIKEKDYLVTEKDVNDGVKPEDYDIKEDIPYSRLTEQDLSGKESVDVTYDLEANEVVQALRKFQKLTIYKKNYIYTLVLFIIFFAYIIKYLQNPSDSLSMFLSVVTVSVISVVWYMPLNHVKKMGKAIEKGEKITFNLRLYDSCLIVGEGSSKTVIEFDKVKITPFETELLFGIGVGKERVFIIPKRCISQPEEEVIRRLLKI